MADVRRAQLRSAAAGIAERRTMLGPARARSAEYVVDPARSRCSRPASLFSLFLLALGKSPGDFFELVWRGGFGTAFSWQNTLQRAAPLILTALARGHPGPHRPGHDRRRGRAGASAASPRLRSPCRSSGHAPPVLVRCRHGARRRCSSARIWIGLAGWLRHERGVNETISSLLLTYIAIAIMNFFVEGALRDPGNPPTSPRPCRSATPTWSARFPAPTCIGASPSASCSPSCSTS